MEIEGAFFPPKGGGGTMKTESFFYLFKKFKKLEMIFFSGCNVFFYSRNTVTSSKIYRTSDLENTMNRLLVDRQWTPFWRSENGLFHYIQGHDFDQINSFFV